MNKFSSSIANGSDSVMSQRAQLMAEQTKQKQTQLIQRIEEQITEKKIFLATINDLNPESKDSLRPGGPNYNADSWVNNNQAAQEELLDLEVRLKIAKATFQEWFSETTPA